MDISRIKKRDGRIVDFEKEKIAQAIYKAAKAVGGKDYQTAQELADKVVEIAQYVDDDEIATVESIQDLVEKVLVKNGHYKTAKAYILYRKQHEDLRQVDQLLFNNQIITNYLERNDWRIKENSNMTYSLQGMNFHLSSVIVSQYWLDQIYTPQMKAMQSSGDFHIHDLGILGVYCVGWDIRDLLLEGFKGVRGKVASGPAKHFRSILGQIVNFFFTLQGEAAGAQAFSNFDTLLAPFIRYDNLDYKQVKQGLQEFVFNMNVPTRVGFQTPFTNVTLDLKVPEFMKDEPVIIGGKYMDATYGEFQAEMDIFNQAFAEVMMEGDCEERVFTFPIPTYNITKDFDWDNPNYDKIWEITAKYGIPNFSNFINSDMSPEDARSMCCRLRLDNRELRKRGGGLFGANPLTGSIGVVTINMSRLGYLSSSKQEYFERLAEVMDVARDSLEIKRKVLENLTESGLYPYSQFYLRNVKAGFGQYWKNHFSTIGMVGMNESCLNFLGQDLASPAGIAFTKEVMDFMRERLSQYQEESGNIYNLEATPAEGVSYGIARKDKETYPQIIVANEADYKKGAEPYYTNSTQLPVNYTDDLFEALLIQDELQTRYTGGTTFHIFLGESISSITSVKKLVFKVCEQFKLPYFTVTPTFSICPSHGYISGQHHSCPICEAEGKQTVCEVYSRVVGYLRPIDQWNAGKQEEFKERSVFDKAIN
ncbi:Ribonucleoside-triphosphate reductase, anaerobic [Syntrophomonas zehnderi OL-4]|uniref:Ribonucleoside-triphosphate reductase, anaerobic n=1 Tax=Syntrophomonas zehnderi OL-4 TaxID=690567 RepID=A0A0E3W2K7_9FIRM|nr:ribonucleoside triphosphate reductase [Syntrophomonas zehnderi]CFX06091.1 Ribonucleoside-triphosphate reductase, anaerobic [Syntrophomonas zehnderi OL-4]CFX33823.1 Ribonucleoside-triphosphate reductase, anaerobic [Syntrophomonas zehnderi OL-4]